MTSTLAPGSTIGIIGGGQLGRMLAMAAARLGYRTVILEPQPDCPAAQVANRQIVGAYDDLAALEELASSVHVVTYEFENVALGGIGHLARSVPVYPPVRALQVSQDRLDEKRFLNSVDIPTAAFHAVDSLEDLARGLADFSGRGVLKTRRLGYDGKGQHVFRGSDTDIETVFARFDGALLILEQFVEFRCEISVIAVRSGDGEIVAYDPAENVHRGGILATSAVPAGVPAATLADAAEKVRRLLDALDYVGVVGLEFFVLADGTLLANEMAPRVHNSGHWTEAACTVSQFENHIRAVCGLPLGPATRHSDCIMENLIGNDVEKLPAFLREPETLIHLYGKAEIRDGRKMGHVTRLQPK